MTTTGTNLIMTAERIREALAPIAERHGAGIQQIAMAWQLHRSPVSMPIPGTTSIAHFDENLAAGEIRLSPDEVTQITAMTPEP